MGTQGLIFFARYLWLLLPLIVSNFLPHSHSSSFSMFTIGEGLSRVVLNIAFCNMLQVLQKCCIALFTPISRFYVYSLFIFLSHWYRQYRLYKEKENISPSGINSPQKCFSLAKVLQMCCKVLQKCCIAVFTPISGPDVLLFAVPYSIGSYVTGDVKKSRKKNHLSIFSPLLSPNSLFQCCILLHFVAFVAFFPGPVLH